MLLLQSTWWMRCVLAYRKMSASETQISSLELRNVVLVNVAAAVYLVDAVCLGLPKGVSLRDPDIIFGAKKCGVSECCCCSLPGGCGVS
ncbi:hypothetical protein RRG08_032806 [Elysia crispata]|uniref:Uncharacterized protein n=1 Tax=Elysia crispata TaxID=231223 RepID=A0AAE0YPF4_9GAST|nr:hypothetical protein RRG08_032806 [Elysia crispata]